ncbi:hypothetical protein OGZ37_05485 [Lactococcus lactis]|uniref:hypothetical protein n=1 Tax=Lactococcus lactis TaxID=1358 RepID=UPI0024187902|nr:hypothetical protein [Lactococcus lactis]MDG4966026.1 hypothetical protein [Lactococcus lactis]
MELLDTVFGTIIGIAGTTGVNLYLRKADFKLNSKEKAFLEYEKLNKEYEEIINFLETNREIPSFDSRKIRKILAYLEHIKKVYELFSKYCGERETIAEVNHLYEMNFNVVSFLSKKERQYLFKKYNYLKKYIDKITEGEYLGEKILYSYSFFDSYFFNQEERQKLLAGESLTFTYFNQKLQRKEEVTGKLRKTSNETWYFYKQ